MWNPRYFANRYFAPRYWMDTGPDVFHGVPRLHNVKTRVIGLMNVRVIPGS